MRALAPSCLVLAAVASGCATSEDVPTVVRDGAVSAEGGSAGAGGASSAGGAGMGGAAGLPSNGGAWFNGNGGSAGASITCGMTKCPDCVSTAFFGTQCCKADGTCGCKAFFGIANCM